MKTKIKSATIGAEKLSFRQDADNWARIQLPMRKKRELIEVIKVEFAGAPEVDVTAIGVDPIGTTAIRSDFAKTSGARRGKSS